MINGYIVIDLEKLNYSSSDDEYIDLDETLAIELFKKLDNNSKPILMSYYTDEEKYVYFASYSQMKSSRDIYITNSLDRFDMNSYFELELLRTEVEGSEGEYHYYAKYKLIQV